MRPNRTAGVCAACGLALCATLAHAQPASSPWPMFRRNVMHTGLSPYAGPSIPKLRWSYQTGDRIYSSPSLGTQGAVYVGSYDDRLYRVSSTGVLDWSYQTAGYVESSPAVGTDGYVYVGSSDNVIYAIDSTGPLGWSYRTGLDILSCPVLRVDGSVFIGSFDNCLYAIASSGVFEWSYRTQHDLWSSPALGPGGSVFVGSHDNTLYAYGSSGALAWSYWTQDDVLSSPALGSDGTVHVGSVDNRLYVFNSLGALNWSYQTLSYVYSSPAIGIDGDLYFGSFDWNNYAVSSAGALAWSYRTRAVFSSSAVESDGTIYVCSYDNNLYSFTSGGVFNWTYTMSGYSEVRSSPSLGSDGDIYMGSSGGTIYCIEQGPTHTPTETPVITPTPTVTTTPAETPTETPVITPTPTVTTTPAETPTETPIAPTPTPDPPRGAFAAVSCANAGGAHGSVWMIDLETNGVMATIPAGGRPQGLCITADRAWIYAANSLDGTVSVIHTGLKGIVSTIAVSPSPRGVRESIDGGSVYVACGEQGRPGSLAVIEKAAGAVVHEVPVGDRPFGIVEVPGEKFLLVGNMDSNDISIIDTSIWRETGRLRGFKTPVGMLWREGSLFVANYGAGGLTPSVARRDYDSVAWVKQWIRPWQVAAFGNSLFVTEYAQDRVAVMDPSTGKIVKKIGVGAGPDGIAAGPGGDYLYAANYWSSDPGYGGVGTVSVVDRRRGAEVGVITVGDNPSQIAVAGAQEEPWPAACPAITAGLNLCVEEPEEARDGAVTLSYRIVPGTGIGPADALLGIRLPTGALLAVDGATGDLVPVGSPLDVARIPRMAVGLETESASEGAIAFTVPPGAPPGAYRYVGALLDRRTGRVTQQSESDAFTLP